MLQTMSGLRKVSILTNEAKFGDSHLFQTAVSSFYDICRAIIKQTDNKIKREMKYRGHKSLTQRRWRNRGDYVSLGQKLECHVCFRITSPRVPSLSFTMVVFTAVAEGSLTLRISVHLAGGSLYWFWQVVPGKKTKTSAKKVSH